MQPMQSSVARARGVENSRRLVSRAEAGCIEIADSNLWVGSRGDERRLWIDDAVVGLGVLGEDTDVDPPPLRSDFNVGWQCPRGGGGGRYCYRLERKWCK
jgi:hypothetical protein